MVLGLRRGGLVCLARLSLLLPRDPPIAVLSLALKENFGIFWVKAKVGSFLFLLAGAEKVPRLFASLLTRSPSLCNRVHLQSSSTFRNRMGFGLLFTHLLSVQMN
jgi:hypothetical protein